MPTLLSTFFHHLGKIIPCNFHSNEKGVTNFFQEGKTIFFLNGLKKKAVVTKYSDFYMIISKYENKSFEEFPFKM
jgi:hypothetical protein